jgi:hypothetical protein
MLCGIWKVRRELRPSFGFTQLQYENYDLILSLSSPFANLQCKQILILLTIGTKNIKYMIYCHILTSKEI